MAFDSSDWFAADLSAAAHEALARVQAEAAALRGTLGIARALHASGRAVDLSGLQDRAGLLCARALDLPPEQGRVARVTLIHLRTDLDTLIAELRARS